MCGISAFFSFTKTIDQAHIEKLNLCNQEMIYRGPDEQNVWNHKNVGLAHVRLSIIGIENGHQPLFNENKKRVLICNGEIYNYQSLKKDLISKGHIFYTESDSEVIIHLYEEYGEECVKFLDGMFAFCLYDIEKNLLFIGRDPAGQKPLYYSILPTGIILSSELKVIKKNFIDHPEINYEILRQVQKNSYSISPQDTYIRQIKKIPSGNIGIININNGLTLKKYTKEVIVPSYTGSYSEATLKVKDLLFTAVEKRLQSEVPVAILLSAGVDSSAIACIAKELGHDVHVIAAGYKGNHHVDERKEAKRLSDEKGFIWHEIELDVNDFQANSQKIYSILDEPVADVAMFAQWGIYKKSKELGFTVLLSGNGGDELFYGYQAHNNYSKGLDYINHQKKYFPITSKKNLVKFFIRLFLNLNKITKINTEVTSHQVQEFIVKNAAEYDLPLEKVNWTRLPSYYSIDQVYYFLKNSWLTNNCHFLADKLGMANSIEIRAPFIDKDLKSFVNTLKIGHKFPHQLPKQLLKDSLKGIVPEYVLNRPKTGFTPPRKFIKNIITTYEQNKGNVNISTFPQLITDYIQR